MQNHSHHSGLWIKIYLDETTNIREPCLPAGRQEFLFTFLSRKKCLGLAAYEAGKPCAQ
jgi:hypothetical protein